jgi:hypothetical protein
MRGPKHPETATSLEFLARLLRDQGDLAGARSLLERALVIRERAFGSEHPQTNLARLNLSLLDEYLSLLDRPFERGDIFAEALASGTADALNALGRTGEAKALRKRYGLTETPRSS